MMPLTMHRLAEKVDRRMQRLSLDMGEEAKDNGDRTTRFMYLKGSFEALQSVLEMANPEMAKGWHQECP